MKKLSIEELKDLLRVFFVRSNISIKSEEWFETIIKVFKDRLTYGEQIISLYNEFINQKFELNSEQINYLKENNSLPILENFLDYTKTHPFDEQNLEDAIKHTINITNIKGKVLYMSLRLASFASDHGPHLPLILPLIGLEEIERRLLQSINSIKENE